MLVNVEQIKEAGLTLDEPVSEKLLAEALCPDGRDTGFRPLREASLRVELQKVSGGVLLQGRLDPLLRAPCKRCLTEVDVRLQVPFTLNLIPKSKVVDEDALREDDEGAAQVGSFALDAADAEVFDGKTIDLDPIIKEQVLLALPMYAVCSEDCKGLCAMCGENLNEKSCGCQQQVVDPRLSVLKDFKLN